MALPLSGTPSPLRPAAPGVMHWRLCGPLATLAGLGAVRFDDPRFITLVLRADEAAQGGMVTISLPVDVWCTGCGPQTTTPCEACNRTRKVRTLYSAWLAIKPGAEAGEELAPTVELPGMVEPVRFRIALAPA